MFRSNGILFGSKDIDILTALPVKSSEIISSKFSFMYLINLLIAVIFMIPGGIIWIVNAKPDVLHSVIFMLSTFFVPLIPMCIASVIGVLIVFVSSHFKNRSIFAVILSFIALGLVAYFASFGVQSGNQDISNSFKEHSPFIALYQKEFGRFFSSYIAVLNTGLGIVLLCVFSIFLLIMSPEKLGEYAGITDMNGFLAGYAPLVVAAMLSLSCPSASSISLEGKNIWILQSTPISMKIILNSKIAVTLTLHFFGYLLSVFAMLTRLQINIGQVVSLIVVPICYSLFTAVLGISLNKKHPNFDWSSEVMVVKQSIPAMASGIVGMFFVVLPALLNWFLQFPILPMLWAIGGMLMISTVILYRKACVSNYI